MREEEVGGRGGRKQICVLWQQFRGGSSIIELQEELGCRHLSQPSDLSLVCYTIKLRPVCVC